jgi:hypothetical protein
LHGRERVRDSTAGRTNACGEPNTLPLFLQTFRGDEPVPWRGTDYGCAAAVTGFVVPPDDSLHIVHQLVAAQVGAPATARLPPATYRIRALMNPEMPDLETEVTIIE